MPRRVFRKGGVRGKAAKSQKKTKPLYGAQRAVAFARLGERYRSQLTGLRRKKRNAPLVDRLTRTYMAKLVAIHPGLTNDQLLGWLQLYQDKSSISAPVEDGSERLDAMGGMVLDTGTMLRQLTRT